MKAKEKHKQNLLTYLGDPDNEFPKRVEYPGILKIHHRTLYFHFSSDELAEIENEAIEIRKKRSTRQRAVIYKALYEGAKDGNVQAAKEWLERVEGKVKNQTEIDFGKHVIANSLNIVEQLIRRHQSE